MPSSFRESARAYVSLEGRYHVLCRSELARENVNDNASFLNECGAGEFFASKLAPSKAAALRQYFRCRLL
ncbi:hypothetical protein TX23_18205 [Pseudomonas paralactis]|uniref:Uncharacterized protein n=1 Tax=Pseudomonas paralactis TaxID=1615673 RepID=A0A0R3ACZ6_9PSED|nr:hypothetical protein TX23_18205 [Pseudomonas paralactis]